MDIGQFLDSLQASALATWIRESLYAFPLIESFHVIGLTLVFGTTAILDLRLMGLASVQRPFRKVAADLLKWTWAGFALAVMTGLLMFITNAQVYFNNLQFRLKMAALVLAGINVLVFELTAGRTIHRWDSDKAAPFSGRLAGAFSLVLWISIIFLGRWIGFRTSGQTAPTNDIQIEDIFK